MRNLFLALALLAALSGCRRAAPVADPEPEPEPFSFPGCNLVFVSFDALQASYVGCLGNPRDVTPTIDAMARQGFLFTNAFAVASWTVPSSMTWFTGVYPSEHGIVNKFRIYRPPVRQPVNLKSVSPHLVTLADVLKAEGYVTGGFTGNAGVSGGFGYEQGFDVYSHEEGKFGRMDRSIPEALKWLRANRDKKFFLFLHGYDIHGQSTPKAGYDYRFVEKGYDMRYSGSEQEQETLREEGLEKGKVALREQDVRFWRAVYNEKIQRTDELFAGFLRELEKLGLAENTLFVLTSDHGTELHEHGRFDHGYGLHTEMLAVPLVIKLPGRTDGKRIAERVGSIEVMPTVLDLMGVRGSDKVRRQMRAPGLVGAMRGEKVGRDIFSETDYREYTFQRSIIAPDGWKLIRAMEKGARELYDMKDDPGELIDLSRREPAKADELERRLFAHFKAIGHDLTARKWATGLNPVYKSQEK